MSNRVKAVVSSALLLLAAFGLIAYPAAVPGARSVTAVSIGRPSTTHHQGAGTSTTWPWFSTMTMPDVTTTTLYPNSCGNPLRKETYNRGRKLNDALFILQVAAIAFNPCSLCVCDVNDSGDITGTDALAVLQHAVGLRPRLFCPSCIYPVP